MYSSVDIAEPRLTVALRLQTATIMLTVTPSMNGILKCSGQALAPG